MKETVTILYVEDNEDYITFVKRAIGKLDIPVVLQPVTDGSRALDLLTGSELANQLRLILLDINLPGISGIELLQKIRSKKEMQLTPVIMFSTSDNPREVQKCYEHGANAYVVKPLGLDTLTSSLNSICNFWIKHNYAKN
ncbi:MAG: response regulator [Ferruginibacter sp.]